MAWDPSSQRHPSWVGAPLATAAGLTLASTPAPAEARVQVEDYSFKPSLLAITAGASVVWTIGDDPEQHTVTPRQRDEFPDSGQLLRGDTFTVVFEDPGRIEYYCRLHPTMTGIVVVEPTVLPSAPEALSPATRTADTTPESKPVTPAGTADPAQPGEPSPFPVSVGFAIGALAAAVSGLAMVLLRRRSRAGERGQGWILMPVRGTPSGLRDDKVGAAVGHLRRDPMKRLVVASALAGSLALASVGSALGAIHPIVSAECAAALASAVANEQNPPGQFKGGAEMEAAFFSGEVAATGSFLRAVIATGVILVDEDGFFAGVDLTRAALNGDSGVVNNCPNA